MIRFIMFIRDLFIESTQNKELIENIKKINKKNKNG